MTAVSAARLVVAVLGVGAVLAGVILLGLWANDEAWVCTTDEVPTGAVGTAAQGWAVTTDCRWQR